MSRHWMNGHGSRIRNLIITASRGNAKVRTLNNFASWIMIVIIIALWLDLARSKWISWSLWIWPSLSLHNVTIGSLEMGTKNEQNKWNPLEMIRWSNKFNPKVLAYFGVFLDYGGSLLLVDRPEVVLKRRERRFQAMPDSNGFECRAWKSLSTCHRDWRRSCEGWRFYAMF